ncbi:hypothetical protein M8818_000325 [Zalaria obscura]|uniref:Uncharacterized protein n=1 Tax=Zalaria obscura TaxID=2024903 RepID=A0ACC3SQ73_9PEZI
MSQSVPIELSDSEDEDLKRAIAMSLAEEPAALVANQPSNTRPRMPGPSTLPTPPSSQGTGIPGLDRRAMEQERLARLATRIPKRERSVSPPALSRPTKVSRIGSFARSLHNFATPIASPQQNEADGAQDTDTRPYPIPKSFQQDLQYPHGVVRKTWAFGHERVNDVKIEEVLEPATLRTAVLSAFQWDDEWVISKVNLKQTKLIFVMQEKDHTQRAELLNATESKSLRVCLPPMPPMVNCMHSKLMLLFHPHKLRIAIPSANLVPYDWGETGTMENSVFMIDLPRKDETACAELPSFAKELLFFLEKSNLHEDARNGLLNFDFSATKDYAFVHSVGGSHYGQDLQRTGLVGLSKAVRDLGLQTEDLQLDFAASSIGSLNDEYLRAVHSAARGVDPVASGSAPAKSSRHPAAATDTSIRDKFRIYFPTHATVTSSTGGHAGTICLQRRWFESDKFPKVCFRDYQSTRKGLLSHNKILYARGKSVAWAYVGSANMSESAWGKLVWDRSRKEWKLNCKNWECGVLIPVGSTRDHQRKTTDDETASEDEASDSEDGVQQTHVEPGGSIPMSVFKDKIGVPFQYPGQLYDGKEPWYFTEH